MSPPADFHAAYLPRPRTYGLAGSPRGVRSEVAKNVCSHSCSELLEPLGWQVNQSIGRLLSWPERGQTETCRHFPSETLLFCTHNVRHAVDTFQLNVSLSCVHRHGKSERRRRPRCRDERTHYFSLPTIVLVFPPIFIQITGLFPFNQCCLLEYSGAASVPEMHLNK